MEYVPGGELFQLIAENGRLTEWEAIYLFRQMIAPLMYCHRIHISHRDLKPENILVDRESMTIKLIDFGMAAFQPEGTLLTTPCGSPNYAAPEVILGKAYDGSKADVWSCGVILYVMLAGHPPFMFSGNDRDFAKLYAAVNNADYVMPPDLSNEAQDLIARMIEPDPARRISIVDVWRHAFMHKYNGHPHFPPENAPIDSWIGPSTLR